MADNNSSRVNKWGIGLLSFIAGLFIGLVVLGWGLFPVQWTGGTMESISPSLQQDYLRASIDSFSLRADPELARQRYNNLGIYKENTLATISESPDPQSSEEIAAFTAAVGAASAVAAQPTSPPTLQPSSEGLGRYIASPAMATICILVFLLVCVFIILAFWLRSILKRKSRPEEPKPEIPGELIEEPVETPASPGEEEAEIDSHEELETTEKAPDWLLEEDQGVSDTVMDVNEVQPDEDHPGVGIAAAAIAGAAILGDEETPAEDIAGVIEKPLEEEELQGLSEKDENSWVDEAMIAAAGIATGAAISKSTVDEESLEKTGGEIDLEPGEIAAAEILAAEVAPELEEQKASEASISEEIVVIPVVEEALQEEDAQLESIELETLESPEETLAKFSKDLQFVEGIGPVFAEKLRSVGISSPLLMLRNGATPKGRLEIAEKTGISHKLILTWVNHIDLYRIKGIGSQYADLLEAAGVDTVVELANRNPKNLHQHIMTLNQEKNLVRNPPALSQVNSWIEQAKRLPRAVMY